MTKTEQLDPVGLVVAPPGHEWREVTYDEWRSDSIGDLDESQTMYLRNGMAGHYFVAVPVPVWPEVPGEYRMRRGDGVVVTALLDSSGWWTWLAPSGDRWLEPDHAARDLLSPVVES